MRVLIAIPHVFKPVEGSLYSSQNAGKELIKQKALRKATIDNLCRHGRSHWIHASLGKGKPIVTRRQSTSAGIDLTIQLYTVEQASLAATIPAHPNLEIINIKTNEYHTLPSIASRRALEQASEFDLVAYMEDDILIEDHELFAKILLLTERTNGQYAFVPHRCEMILGKGDVILSGDPDGGRADLFWATGETICVQWPLGDRHFYRATNPHSGCYFLSKQQALMVNKYWEQRNWISDFQLSGPLEHACSGYLLPVLKVMKPIPSDYRFLMVRHQDELWTRHPFEVEG